MVAAAGRVVRVPAVERTKARGHIAREVEGRRTPLRPELQGPARVSREWQDMRSIQPGVKRMCGTSRHVRENRRVPLASVRGDCVCRRSLVGVGTNALSTWGTESLDR